MNRIPSAILAAVLLVIPFAVPATMAGKKPAFSVSSTDWPWWRGPQRNGIAPAGSKPPVNWSSTKNVVWKVAIPGRGHGSATVFGDRVFLAAAEEIEDLKDKLDEQNNLGADISQHHIGS